MPVPFRNISADERSVLYGVPRPKRAAIDAVVDIADEAAPSYDCQPDIWQRVGAATPAPPVPTPVPAAPAASETEEA